MLDFVELFETRVRNNEIKLVVLLKTPHCDQNVRRGKRASDFGQRHVERLQFVWIDRDAVLLDATALDAHARNSRNRGKRRTQSVEGEIAQLDERMRIGSEAVGDRRKNGRVHPLDFERSAGRQRRQNFVHLRLALQHGRDHVFAPIEVDRNFGGAAAGGRSHAAHSRNGADRFLYRRRHFNCHPLGWPITGVESNAHPGKTDVRKQRHRQRKTRDYSSHDQGREEEENRARMALRPRGEAHFAFWISTAIPSSSSELPTVTTESFSFRSSPMICTSSGFCRPTFTMCLTALPSATVKTS